VGNLKNAALLEQRRQELVRNAAAVFVEQRFDKTLEDGETSPAARFAAAYGGYLDNVHRNRREVLLMYREYTQLPREAQDYFRALESQIYDRLARIVRDGVEAGAFACEAPRLFAIDCVMRAHTLALKEWALGRTSYRQTRKQLLAWSLRALGVPPQ
jgi:hypothetical protein